MTESPVEVLARMLSKEIELKEMAMLHDALVGSRGNHQQLIARAGLRLTTTLLRKNKDYGSSLFEPPLLAPNIPAKQGILVRLSDKIKRIIQLQSSGSAEVAESLADTILDNAGYSILWLACPEGEPSEEVQNNPDSQSNPGQPAERNSGGAGDPDQVRAGD